MYTFKPPICIPKRLCGESASGQHPKRFRGLLCHPKVHGAVRFLFGGFTSTAGYVPGNEARDLSISSDIALFGMIISLKRYPFLSGQPRPAFRPTLASLSASTPGVHWQRHSAPSAIERYVTVSVPPPGVGRKPVSNSTMYASYAFLFRCQVENTLTIALILRAFCGNSVDNAAASLWIRMWKIGQHF